MTAPDLRPLVERAAEVSDLRQRRTGMRAAAVLLGLAALFVAVSVAQDRPGGLVLAVALVGTAAMALVGALVHRRRPVAVLRTVPGTLPGITPSTTGAATQVRAPGARLAQVMLMLAWLGASAAGVGVTGVRRGAVVLGVLLLVSGVALVLPPVMWALGRYVPGALTMDRETLRYRAFGLESTVRWADVAAVEWSEPEHRLVLRVGPDAAVTHRYRSWPLRGLRADGPTSAVLAVRDWGLLPTDLARLVVLCAADPAARAELGTPTALLRARGLVGQPFARPTGRWQAGAGLPTDHPESTAPTPGLADGAAADQPVWHEPAVIATRRVAGYYRRRFFLTLGAVSVAVGFSAGIVGIVEPASGVPLLALATAGLCSAIAALRTFPPPSLAPVARTAPHGADGVVLARSRAQHRLRVAAVVSLGVWLASTAFVLGELSGDAWGVLVGVLAVPLLTAPLLVLRGVVTPGAITVTPAGIGYRNGLRRWSVPWSSVQSAQLAWDDVVYLRLHLAATPGGADRRTVSPRGRLLDARGTAASGTALAQAVDHWAQRGGPGTEALDVSAVATRLGLPAGGAADHDGGPHPAG